MSVTEGLMQVGSWNLRLNKAPIEIRRKFGWFNNIVITAGRIYDTNLDRDALLAAAKYSGIIMKRNLGEGSFGGLGLLAYLQTGRGHSGAIGSYNPTWPADFDDIIQAWVNGSQQSNGLACGTNAGVSAFLIQSMETQTYWPPTKPLLDDAAKQTGNEYVCRPDGTIDYGFNQFLFPTFTTPTVLISPTHHGKDDVAALEVESWSVDQDILDFRNYAFMTSQDGTQVRVTASSGGSLMPLYGWGGLAAAGEVRYFDRLNANTNDVTDLSDQTIAAAAEFADVNYRIQCTVREFCIPRFVTPGDWVWVHDPDNDITGAGIVVTHFGQSVTVEKFRCHGYTWPIEAGMGVYVIDNDTQEVTDVSDFVQWETGSTRLELGSPPKRLTTNTTVSRFK